jgi:hypothetical protein
LPDSDIELMHSWLVTIFSSLNLSSRYIEEILKTAAEASTRVAKDHDNLDILTHLAIYVPFGPITQSNTWGLFHIERIEFPEDIHNPLNHAINFYLYVEGEAT